MEKLIEKALERKKKLEEIKEKEVMEIEIDGEIIILKKNEKAIKDYINYIAEVENDPERDLDNLIETKNQDFISNCIDLFLSSTDYNYNSDELKDKLSEVLGEKVLTEHDSVKVLFTADDLFKITDIIVKTWN